MNQVCFNNILNIMSICGILHYDYTALYFQFKYVVYAEAQTGDCIVHFK